MVASSPVRLLYHFPLSPFSRRARLALAHKALDVTLRDARADAALLDEARARSAIKTIPLLVEPDGRALGDSGAIAHYLDAAYGGAALWPRGDARDASAMFEIAALVDVALNTIVDLGSRYFDLKGDAAWPAVKGEMVGRAQSALDALGERAASLGRPTVLASGWCAADIWLFTATAWLEGLPARAATNKNVGQIVTLGWTLPAALSRWADAHRERADVRALG